VQSVISGNGTFGLLVHVSNVIQYQQQLIGNFNLELVLHLTAAWVFVCAAVLASDKRITCDEEFSDSEDEGEGGRKHTESFKNKRIKLDEKGDGKSALAATADKGLL